MLLVSSAFRSKRTMYQVEACEGRAPTDFGRGGGSPAISSLFGRATSVECLRAETPPRGRGHVPERGRLARYALPRRSVATRRRPPAPKAPPVRLPLLPQVGRPAHPRQRPRGPRHRRTLRRPRGQQRTIEGRLDGGAAGTQPGPPDDALGVGVDGGPAHLRRERLVGLRHDRRALRGHGPGLRLGGPGQHGPARRGATGPGPARRVEASVHGVARSVSLLGPARLLALAALAGRRGRARGPRDLPRGPL